MRKKELNQAEDKLSFSASGRSLANQINAHCQRLPVLGIPEIPPAICCIPL